MSGSPQGIRSLTSGRHIEAGREAWIWLSRHASSTLGRNALVRRFGFFAIAGKYALAEREEVFVVSTSDQAIGKVVYISGEFDFSKFEKAFRLAGLTMGEASLVDVGANIGTISIPAVRRGYVRNAVCIEPEPLNQRLLRVNILLNDLEERIAIHTCAAGSTRGRVMLRRNVRNLGDHRIVASGPVTPEEAERYIDVDIIPLDELDAIADDDSVLLWIDVQGFEPDVLKGGRDLLSRSVAVVVEYDPTILAAAGNHENFIDVVTSLPQTVMLDLSEEQPRPVPATRSELAAIAARIPAGTGTDLLFIPEVRDDGSQISASSDAAVDRGQGNPK